ncbi:hypothetical protein SS482266_2372 [Shigella sonnei 4822-66]|nr:hypothetical protein SS482266_2372 [Shigella sonnei 4822-66]
MPKAALARLSAITLINGQRYCRQTSTRSSMQKTRTMNYSPQFKHLRAHSNNNSYFYSFLPA